VRALLREISGKNRSFSKNLKNAIDNIMAYKEVIAEQ